jgi:streptogramin lyase
MRFPRRWRTYGAAATGSLTLAILALVGTGAQAAVPGTITEYPTAGGGEPEGMTLGPDGNLWFARGDDGRVGKITTSGAITTYVLPSVGLTTGSNIGLHEITTGPDGNLWFTEQDRPLVHGIGKITTSGTATEYPLPNAGEPFGVAAGADGKIWITDGQMAQVSHINTDGTGIVNIPVAGTAKQIINGPDHKLWFAEDSNGKIGRIDPTVGASSLVEFQAVASAGDSLYGLTVGPDGRIWFGGHDTAGDVVGSITLDGLTVTKFPTPDTSVEPEGLVAGPDGAIWFAESDRDGIGRVTTTGQFTDYLLAAPAGGTPRPVSPSPGVNFDQRDVHQLVLGADANLWWTEGGTFCPTECSVDINGSIGTLALAQPSLTPSPAGSQAPASVGLPNAGAATGGPPDLRWIGAVLALALAAPPWLIVARRARRRV